MKRQNFEPLTLNSELRTPLIRRCFASGGRWLVAAALLLLLPVIGLLWRSASRTPEEKFVQRWFTACRREAMPDAVALNGGQPVTPAMLVTAVNELARPDNDWSRRWLELRGRLPQPVRAWIPMPFTESRRAAAVAGLLSGRFHEAGVIEALVRAATNPVAANRCNILLLLGLVDPLPAHLAQPLAALTNDPDARIRTALAYLSGGIWPRTAQVTNLQETLLQDGDASVRQAAQTAGETSPTPWLLELTGELLNR